MKVATADDLHLEFGAYDIKNTEGAKVLVLPGDICVARDLELMDAHLYGENKRARVYMDFFHQATQEFEHVLYVMGNHEHYNGDFAYTHSILKRKLMHFPNLHVLEKETFVVDDVTFVGATLWTDMNKGDPMTLHAIKDMMNDFRGVKNSHNMVSRKVPLYEEKNPLDLMQVRTPIGYKFKEEPSKFTPQDAFEDHVRALRYIEHVVAEKADEKFVVVTHHTPSFASCADEYKHDTLMNGGYHSELSEFILDRPQIKVWLHGHTHVDLDYMIGPTRVICNPRGYVGYEPRSKTFNLKYFDV